MFCSNCGSKIGDNAKFCASCGVKVGESSTSKSNSESENSAPKIKNLNEKDRLKVASKYKDIAGISIALGVIGMVAAPLLAYFTGSVTSMSQLIPSALLNLLIMSILIIAGILIWKRSEDTFKARRIALFIIFYSILVLVITAVTSGGGPGFIIVIMEFFLIKSYFSARKVIKNGTD